MTSNKSTELKELVRNVYQEFTNGPSGKGLGSNRWKVCFSDFIKIHGRLLAEHKFYDLLIEIIQEDVERMSIESDDLVTLIIVNGVDIDEIKSLQTDFMWADRFQKLIQGEQIEEYDPPGDINYRQSYRYLNRKIKIDSLAESYWIGEIDRDHLLKAIDIWNKRNSPYQCEIKLGNIFASIRAYWRSYKMPETRHEFSLREKNGDE